MNEQRTTGPEVTGEEQCAGEVFVTLNTEFGPIVANKRLVRVWNEYGWPTDAVLKKMADMEPPTASGEETTT